MRRKHLVIFSAVLFFALAVLIPNITEKTLLEQRGSNTGSGTGGVESGTIYRTVGYE
jgi:hypothetical protein